MLSLRIAGWPFTIEGRLPAREQMHLAPFEAPPEKDAQRIVVAQTPAELTSPVPLADGSLFQELKDGAFHVWGAAASETPLVVGLVALAARRSAAVLHGAAVHFKGRALLMAGVSGAGKSTWATLMADLPLLSDEFNVLKRSDDGALTLSGTPLRSTSPRLPNALTAPLGALLFPVKDARDFLAPLSPDVALQRLVPHAVTPQIPGLRPPFALLAEAARRTPAFEFHFRKDPACRALLDELPFEKPLG